MSSTNKGINNEKIFIDRFNNRFQYRKEVLDKLGYTHENIEEWNAYRPGSIWKVTHTPEWDRYKQGSKENTPNPKTDAVLINRNKNTQITLSVKSGRGRATSADCYETRAILLSVLDNYRPKEHVNMDRLNVIVQELDRSMLRDKFDSKLTITDMKCSKKKEDEHYKKEYEWYEKFCDSNNMCNTLWKELVTYFSDFTIQICEECLSGRNKFGDTTGRADYLVQLRNTNSTEIEIAVALKPSFKLELYCKKYIDTKPFAGKSSGLRCWQRFM